MYGDKKNKYGKYKVRLELKIIQTITMLPFKICTQKKNNK